MWKNGIKDVLNRYGLDTKKLDFFVWTHPDLDHSLGIPQIIENYSNQYTQILLPVGFKKEIIKSFKSELYKAAYSVFLKI